MKKSDSNIDLEFQRLLMEQKSTIYSVCFMFAESREETDDLFQETLVNLWKGYGKFRGDSAIGTWVYRVSLNTCLSYNRKKRVKTVPLDLSSDVMNPKTDIGRQNMLLHERISRLEPFDRAIVLNRQIKPHILGTV